MDSQHTGVELGFLQYQMLSAGCNRVRRTMCSHLYICGMSVGHQAVLKQLSELLNQLLTAYHKGADMSLLT